jgi:hypothetical protein
MLLEVDQHEQQPIFRGRQGRVLIGGVVSRRACRRRPWSVHSAMYPKNAASKGGTSAANSSTVTLVKSHTSVVWVGRSPYRNMACASFRARHSITQIVMNSNIYADKEDVYLDGGPGVGAPQDGAGLPDGTYVFQVTDPSSKTSLSTDFGGCRQFTVADGVISGVVATGCQHVTGVDADHGAVTVQLMPFLDTPNNGGEYKVWVTLLEDFLLGCQELGKAGTRA